MSAFCALQRAAALGVAVLLAVPSTQAVSPEWVRRYNGPGNGQDVAVAMVVDASRNIYVTGESQGSDGIDDYATIKYDPNGAVLWMARYDGPTNDTSEARAIAVGSLGNVYVAGRSAIGLYHDYATVKYDPNGAEAWAARYNGPGGGQDAATSLTLDAHGNILVTGTSDGAGTGNDYATIKYDPGGNVLWVARYNGPANREDGARAIAVDQVGNFVVTGSSDGNGTEQDFATVKYDPNGTQLWVSRYDGPVSGDDYAAGMALDPWGNVCVTGRSKDIGIGQYDYATVKYDPNGVELWVRRYDGPTNDKDRAVGVATDDVGNIYVTGYSLNNADGSIWYSCVTIKYDPEGNQLWAADYSACAVSLANAIAVDAAGNAYITGRCGGDCLMVKYGPAGNQVWAGRYSDPAGPWDEGMAIAVDALGNTYVAGQSDGGSTALDYVTLKYSATPTVASLCWSDPPPNGFLPKTGENTLTLRFDIPISMPADSPLHIVEIDGSDVTDLFTYTIEPDGVTLLILE